MSSSSSSGIGFSGLLTVLFIALKLTGVIAWSWLWVLCPLWIGFALAALFLIGVGVSLGIAALLALFIVKCPSGKKKFFA